MPSGAEESPEGLVRRGWEQLQLRRPLAAWASWQQALRVRPGDPAASEALERLAQSTVLPGAAKHTYRFRAPSGEARRQRWDQALKGRDLAVLAEAAQVFRALAESDPDDAEASYNLGLCLAWQGQQVPAIQALHRFVVGAATSQLDNAADAWMLAEVLRHGAGAEDLADDLNYAGSIPWDPDDGPPTRLVPEGRLRRVGLAADNGSGLEGDADHQPFEWLDRPLPAAEPGLDADDLPRVLASLVLRGERLSYSTPDARQLDHLLDPAVNDFAHYVLERRSEWHRQRSVLPLNLLDAAIFAFRFPPGLDAQNRRRLAREAIADAYENRWIHIERFGLGPEALGDPPLSPLEAGRRAAGGDPVARAQLEGIVRLREQLARRVGFEELYASYPFDRLRRRLGLPQLDPNTVEAGDISCMSRTELKALDVARLTAEERAAAHRSAEGLDEPDLARRFSHAPEEPTR